MNKRIVVKRIRKSRDIIGFNSKAGILLISMVGLLLTVGWGVYPRTASKGVEAQEAQEVIVKPGDNLWGLAKRYGDSRKETGRMVFEIQKVNKLETSVIHPGQILLIPRSK